VLCVIAELSGKVILISVVKLPLKCYKEREVFARVLGKDR
jgi:hypothetical protein